MTDNSQEPRNGRSVWDGVAAFLNELGRNIGKLVESGNRRQLIVRTPEGRSLLRMPLTLAVVLLMVVAVLRLLPLLVIAVIIALVLKVQFVFTSDVTRPDADPTKPE